MPSHLWSTTRRGGGSLLGQASLGQAVDLVRQRIGDEEPRQKVRDAAYRQLRGDVTNPADPFAPFLTQFKMATGRRPGDHRIDEARLLDQRPVGPFDGLFVAPGLDPTDRAGSGASHAPAPRLQRRCGTRSSSHRRWRARRRSIGVRHGWAGNQSPGVAPRFSMTVNGFTLDFCEGA
jgi:hypothetical protein